MKQRSEVPKDGADDRARNIWWLCLRVVWRATHDPDFPSLEPFYDDIASAEVDGALSEFYALGFQAVFAMGERADGVEDYLAMAEEVACAAQELAMVQFWQLMHRQTRRDLALSLDLDRTHSYEDDALVVTGGGLSLMFRNLGIIQDQPPSPAHAAEQISKSISSVTDEPRPGDRSESVALVISDHNPSFQSRLPPQPSYNKPVRGRSQARQSLIATTKWP